MTNLFLDKVSLKLDYITERNAGTKDKPMNAKDLIYGRYDITYGFVGAVRRVLGAVGSWLHDDDDYFLVLCRAIG